MTKIEDIYKKLDNIKELSNTFSMMKIAEILDLPYTTMTIVCKKEGIRPKKDIYLKIARKRGEDRRVEILKETLKELYIEKRKTITEISEILSIDRATVHGRLVEYNIKLRKKSGEDEIHKPKYDYDVYYYLYYIKKTSLHQMAKILGYSSGFMVSYDMKKYGIPRRDYKESGKVLWETASKAWKDFMIATLQNIGKKRSSFEILFESWCLEKNIKNTPQYKIPDSGLHHPYDFFIDGTKILVEIDGVYWHTREDAIKRDDLYTKVAKRFGYKIVRITDLEIKNQGVEVFKKRMTENGIKIS